MNENPPFTMEELEKAMSKMRDGIAPDYGMHRDVITRSGKGILTPAGAQHN